MVNRILDYTKRLLMFTALGSAIVISQVVHSHPSWAANLPAVEATDLAGNAWTFPSGLPNDPTLLVVAFSQKQQVIADRMFSLLAQTKAAELGYRIFETPIIENPGAIGRFVINNGMKSGISSPEKRKAVVTLYIKDMKSWMTSMALRSTDDVYVCAVRKNGKVIACSSAKKLKTVEDARNLIAEIESATL